MLEPYKIYLSPKVAEFLTVLVVQGRARQVMTMRYFTSMADESGVTYLLIIGNGNSYEINSIQDDPLFALSALGFIVYDAQEKRIFLTQSGIAWVDYHQQSRIAHAGQWLRSVSNEFASRLIVGIAAALTILQVLQLLGLI